MQPGRTQKNPSCNPQVLAHAPVEVPVRGAPPGLLVHAAPVHAPLVLRVLAGELHQLHAAVQVEA